MQADLKDILDSIDELAHRGSLTRSRAFAAWFAITFFDIEEDDALESAAADGGNDQGIDIAFADASSEERGARSEERGDYDSPSALP